MDNIYETSNANYQTISDIFLSLMPESNILELLLWPPNLFAFTSNILRANAAYQLVVSPPANCYWPPKIKDICETWQPIFESQTKDDKNLFFEVFNNNKNCIDLASGKLSFEKIKKSSVVDIDGTKDGWKDLMRLCGKEWMERLSDFDINVFNDKLINCKDNKSNYLNLILSEITKSVPWPVICFWQSFMSVHEQERRISTLRVDSSTKDNTKETSWIAVKDLISLHAIADEACWGWGLKKNSSSGHIAKKCAKDMLYEKGTMATISTERCRILPKRHNPSSGITLRALSSNLGFQTSAVDVDVNWQHSGESPLDKKVREKNFHSFTILLLPWPLRIYSQDFHPHKFPGTPPVDGINFFAFDPDKTDKEKKKRYLQDGETGSKFLDLHERIIKKLPKVIKKAMDEAGENKLDMVILPEAALNEAILKDVEEILAKYNVSFYIAGVRDKPPDKRFDRNAVYFKTLRKKEDVSEDFIGWEFPANETNAGDNSRRYRQSKHHRWKLNYSQIIKYNLGLSLDPNKEWWEAIKISRRKVSFLNIGDKLTICPLICEDLA